MRRFIKYVFIFFVAATTISFLQTDEKKYHFEFNDQELNGLWNVIENSTAPYPQVKAIQALIQAQLKPQLTDSTAKPKPK